MEKQKLKERKINKKSHFTLHTSSNSGITLVALIITIIVLLILAVVAIRAVQGDGIITKAKEAKSKTTVAQEKEQIGLAANEWKIQKNYQNEPGSFKSFMIEKLTNIASIPDSDPDDGPLTVIMKGTGNEYLVKEDGTIKPPSNIKYVFGDESFGYIVILKPDNDNKQKVFAYYPAMDFKGFVGEYIEVDNDITDLPAYKEYYISEDIKNFSKFIVDNNGKASYAVSNDYSIIHVIQHLVQNGEYSIGTNGGRLQRNYDVDLTEIEEIISK